MTRSDSPVTSLGSPKSVGSPKSARVPKVEVDWENQKFLEAEEEAPTYQPGLSRLPSRAESRKGQRSKAKSGQARRYATVEECPLPSVSRSAEQQLALPCNAQIVHTLRIPVDEFDIRFEAPRAKAAWKQWALSPLCLEIFRDAFWWVLVEEFKKQAPSGAALQAFVFNRIANNYTKLLLPDGERQTQPNDGYLEILALVQAQGLLRAFQVAFPKSKHKFSEAFYRRILRHITQWTVATPRTKDALRDVSHHESGFVGRMIDPNEVRQDFSYDASMSSKAIEQWRASYLPPAHDLTNKDRHSLLVTHFLTSHGILEAPFDKHAYDGVKAPHSSGENNTGSVKPPQGAADDHVGGVKTRTSLTDGYVRGEGPADRPLRELGADVSSTGRRTEELDPNREPAAEVDGKGGRKGDIWTKDADNIRRKKGRGTKSVRNAFGAQKTSKASAGAFTSGLGKPPPQKLAVDVAPHLRTAVSALLAAGLDAQEAVAVASFMHSGGYDSDEEAEVLGFNGGDDDGAGPAERRDPQTVSYAAIAAASFDRTRQALDKYADVRRRGLTSVEVTHKETAHLLQELRHLWRHVGKRDLRYISNALAHWDPKPVVTASAGEKQLERSSAEVRREVEGTLARSTRARNETDRFLGPGAGPGFSWRRTSHGQWRARFEKGEPEEVLAG